MVFGKLQHRSWERSINKQTGPRAPSSHGAGPTAPHSPHKCSSSCYLLLRFVWHLSFGRLLISSSVIQAIINKLRFEREGRSSGKGKENRIQKAGAIRSPALSRNVALGVMGAPALGPGAEEGVGGSSTAATERGSAQPWLPGLRLPHRLPAPSRHLRAPETLAPGSWRRGSWRRKGGGGREGPQSVGCSSPTPISPQT